MLDTLKLVIGVLLVAFGLIGIGVEVDNAANGTSHDRGVGIALIVVCLTGGAYLIRSGRRGRSEPRRVRTQQGEVSASNVVLRIAREQAGRVTAAEIASHSTLSFDEAKAELDRLEKAGACTIEVGENGVRVYYFPEFASPDGKRDII